MAQPFFAQHKDLKSFEITGIIKDKSTLLPLQGAKISLAKNKTTSITDQKGKFSISVSSISNSFLTDSLVIKHNKYWDRKIEITSLNPSSLNILLEAKKQRLIVTTDLGGADPDDIQSMIHLLTLSNEIDIEGLISSLAWVDNVLGVNQIESIIKVYGEVESNLKIHDKDYPSYEYLKSIIKPGQLKSRMFGVGKGKDSPGSELIIASIDKESDARPIWLNAWGGMNTIAQALWKIKETRTTDEVNRFIRKIRIYDVLGQDDAGAWIASAFPDIIYIRNKHIYGWAPSDDWTKKNIQTQGPLGAIYPNRIWATEGDSPAFLYLYPNGLNNPENLDYGGWGGRFNTTKTSGIRGMDFVKKSGVNESDYDSYFMYTNSHEGSEAINKWKHHIWNNFATRMIWTITDKYEEANHHPIISLNGDYTKQVVEYTVKKSSSIQLNANNSTDPDGDKLSYKWFFYKEPSSYTGNVSLKNCESTICEVKIPPDASGKTIHIILEVSDSGKPSLTSYRRIIIHVK